MTIRPTRRALRAAMLGTGVALTMLAMGPAAALGGMPGGTRAVSCTFVDHIVKVTMTGAATLQISRLANGVIGISNAPCGGATVTNTKSIEVRGDADSQIVSLHPLSNGGLKPGYGDEPGSSDEIEIAVSLLGGTDVLGVYGATGPDDIRAGTNWQNGFPYPVINLDATEATGIDTDVLHLGVEFVTIYGNSGVDTLSAAGGAGSNRPAFWKVSILGGAGADTIIGGQNDDNLYGGDGPDSLKGGKGDDFIDGVDGVGHDALGGGEGTDDCDGERGDTKLNCES